MLDEILDALDRVFKKGEFLNDVIRLVLMHQGLPSLKKFSLDEYIPYQHIPKYFTPRLLKLMKILMISDSESYLVNWHQEFIIPHREEFYKIFQKYDEAMLNY